MKIGFYSGSFDPFTNGHLHIVKAACQIFDKVIIGIGVNYNKSRRYPIYLRSGLLGFISSSMIAELVQYNKDVSKYLPKPVLDVIKIS